MFAALMLLLPAAVGFALSPIPLVEMILVLLSKRSRSNGLVFLVCIAVPVFVVPMLSATGLASSTGGQKGMSGVKAWVVLSIAVLLLLMAVRNFVNRNDTSVPKVFAAIENMGPAGVVALSTGATILNPKNLVILLGAGAVAAETGLSTGALAITLILFTVLATLPFIVAVGYVLFGGRAAAERMQRVKQWLLVNNRLMLAVVLGVLGAVMAARAGAVLA